VRRKVKKSCKWRKKVKGKS